MINTDYKMVLKQNSSLALDFDFSNELKQDELTNNNKQWEINRIVLEFFSEQDLSDETVSKLTQSSDFKVDLLKNVQSRMENIIENSSTSLYKELVTVINLLSLGKKYKIFEKCNEYSTDQISKLFRAYESSLLKFASSSKKEKFELTFEYYTTLLGAFNELSIINLTDVKRKKSIKNIIDLMTESINIVKFSNILNESKTAILTTFKGELLLRFSNILYISNENKSIASLIDEYKFIYNKQVDGYLLASKSQLSLDDSNARNNYLNFLVNSTELLLLMLMKLEKYEINYFEKLQDIVELYCKECHINRSSINSLDAFKSSLLSNYVYICNSSLKIKYDELIKYILDNKNLSVMNMQIIHNIVLFSQINNNNLMYILKYLLKMSKMENDYHEYHKLDIVDIIINEFIKRDGFDGFTKYIPTILEYMKNSNTASQLMSKFSKLRLSLSHYFSLLGKKYLSVSQEQYFIGEKICSYVLIKDEYKSIFEQILKK